MAQEPQRRYHVRLCALPARNGCARKGCQNSWQRRSSQTFSASRSGRSGMGCHKRWLESCTFFSTCLRAIGLEPMATCWRGPPCGRIADLGPQKTMDGHCQEPGIYPLTSTTTRPCTPPWTIAAPRSGRSASVAGRIIASSRSIGRWDAILFQARSRSS